MNATARKFRTLCVVSGSLGSIMFGTVAFFVFGLYLNYGHELWFYGINFDRPAEIIIFQIVMPPLFFAAGCTPLIFTSKLMVLGYRSKSVAIVKKYTSSNRLLRRAVLLLSTYWMYIGIVFTTYLASVAIHPYSYQDTVAYFGDLVADSLVFSIPFSVPGALLLWARQIYNHLI